jgi:2,4-dienoyl-CoA reductase-like NADH-dependent reductase (Old Yellow Enzyme family)
MSDSNPPETLSYLAEQLSSLRIGYLHVGEAIAGPMAAPAGAIRVTPILRDKFSGTMIANGGYDAHSGHAAIARGEADLVAFGVPFLANPDLPARYRENSSLNLPDQTTFYAGEEKGYIDYPALARRTGDMFMSNGIDLRQTSVLSSELKITPPSIPEFLSTENATECDFHLGHSSIAR